MKRALHLTLATSLCLVACSGRTVRLDHESMAGEAGAPNEDGSSPTRVYQPPGAPLQQGLLLVDEHRVYWQSLDGAFRSCRKNDCQSSVVTYTASSDLDSAGIQLFANVAVSEGQTFWLASPPHGEVYSCPSTGCREPKRLLRDPSLPHGYGVAADEGQVYWLSAKDIYRCPAAGCGAAPSLAPFGEGALPVFFDNDAFWIQVVDGASRIRRAPKDGSAEASTLVERADTPGGSVDIKEIAISSRYVYWLDDDSRILRCPLSGCAGEPTVLGAEAGPKQRLRADELGAYWLDWREDLYEAPVEPYRCAVHFCAESGCASSTVFGSFDRLDTYALDDDFIYLTARIPRDWGSIGGDIMRMPKPKP
jgi:hypothetical protein